MKITETNENINLSKQYNDLNSNQNHQIKALSSSSFDTKNNINLELKSNLSKLIKSYILIYQYDENISSASKSDDILPKDIFKSQLSETISEWRTTINSDSNIEEDKQHIKLKI